MYGRTLGEVLSIGIFEFHLYSRTGLFGRVVPVSPRAQIGLRKRLEIEIEIFVFKLSLNYSLRIFLNRESQQFLIFVGV